MVETRVKSAEHRKRHGSGNKEEISKKGRGVERGKWVVETKGK